MFNPAPRGPGLGEGLGKIKRPDVPGGRVAGGLNAVKPGGEVAPLWLRCAQPRPPKTLGPRWVGLAVEVKLSFAIVRLVKRRSGAVKALAGLS